MFICLVLWRILGDLAISSAPLLSSKAVHLVMGVAVLNVNSAELISQMKAMRGMNLRRDCESAMYSLSVQLRATSVCILEAQNKGPLAYLRMYPERERALLTSCSAKGGCQEPAKPALA
jgi:hypothetical protein